MSLGNDYDQVKSGSVQRKKKSQTTRNGRKKNSNIRKGKAENTVKSSDVRSENRKRSGKRRRRNKKTDVVSTIVLVVAVCVFVFSLYQLAMMLVPYYSGGQEYEEVKNLAITIEEKDDKEIFKVDFDALLEQNPDTIAWIRFEEPAVISYPVVKSMDNAEYLTKTFTANDNKLGAIFVDMRNNPGFSDRNTFIYGHNMQVGGEMFSQLNEYAAEEFCKEHPYFYIYTPDGKVRTYQVFSAGVVKDTAKNYEMTYPTEEDYVKYLQLCKDSSNYQVDVTLDKSSKIVSLSTCTNINDDERFLVQGVLVSEEMNE